MSLLQPFLTTLTFTEIMIPSLDFLRKLVYKYLKHLLLCIMVRAHFLLDLSLFENKDHVLFLLSSLSSFDRI